VDVDLVIHYGGFPMKNFRAMTLIFASFAAFSASSGGGGSSSPASFSPTLECRLVPEGLLPVPKNLKLWVGPDGMPVPAPTPDFACIVELRNISEATVSIKYRNEPIADHLDLDVRDEKGNVLPKHSNCYACIFSPNLIVEFDGDEIVSAVWNEEFKALKPGERIKRNIRVFNLVAKERRPITPGVYTVEAVFKHQGREFRSNKVTVVMPAE